jgi:conjugative relaxase-like TrwC/TraI family protein
VTLGVSKGSDWRYVAREVGAGAENYYTSAVQTGEPPGRWRGQGAETLGLSGRASDHQLEALFGNFIDPRDERFDHREQWDKAARLGRKPMSFQTHEQIFGGLMTAEAKRLGIPIEQIEAERREQLWHQAGSQVREAVHFFDATYSPSKSVSVLYTAFMSEGQEARKAGREAEAQLWFDRAKLVEDAVWEASGAMIRHMEDRAGYSRSGYHGGKLANGESTGRWIDGRGFTVASFLQHTARPVDGVEAPQLHVHSLILNRIECADGKFRTLDGKAIYQERAAAGATADRVVQARLQRDLGIEFAYDPQSKSFEVTGIGRDVRAVFSARSRDIAAALPRYVEAFESRMGRPPNALELSELSQRATFKTRQKKLPKERASTLERKVEQWTEMARAQSTSTLSEIARACVDARSSSRADRVFDPAEVIAQAVESVQEVKTTWTRSDLIMHLHRHLPAELETLDPAMQDRILGELADTALRPDPERIGTPEEIIGLTAPDMVAVPDEFKLENGESAFHRPGSGTFATRRLLDAEARIEEAARAKSGVAFLSAEAAQAAVDEVNAELRRNDPNGTAALSADQADVLHGVLSSGAKTEVLVGPAGTGKSFVMGQLADQWEKRLGGRVVGLASAQKAANVLADEGLARTANIAVWTDVQAKIEAGKATAKEQAMWRLRRGDLVIVDEASMVGTFQLAEIQERADKAGAKLLLVGDHEQLGAVGPGGSFLLAQESADRVYQLREVRRFKAEWEREASLGLREGSRDAVMEYDARGRLRKCANLDEAYDQAADAYTADVAAGRRSYLVANSNEEANELGLRVRERLVRLGLVEERGVPIGYEKETQAVAGVGDLVQARRNNRFIGNNLGETLVNRNQYVVTETRDDGTMTVQAVGADGALGHPINIPASYAQSKMSLAYASTQHGAQGGTGYGGYGVATPSTSAAGVYVPMTRGTDVNLLFVVDDLDAQDADQLTTEAGDERPERSAAAIVQSIFERDTAEKTATQTVRDNLADTGSMKVIGHRLFEARRLLSGRRWEDLVTGILPEGHDAAFVDDDARYSVYRLLDTVEALGHDVEDVVRTAVTSRELGTADSVAQVLHWRITSRSDELGLDDVDALAAAADREPGGDTYTERVPAGDTAVHTYARDVAACADARVEQLGEVLAENPPAWAIDRIGEVPDNPLGRLEWIHQAGTVEAYREAYGMTDENAASLRPGVSPIGKAPGIHMAERREEWYAAWRALGSPEALADEQTMTDTQLQQRIEAYEAEKSWAPANVSADLKQTSTALQDARTRAGLAEAELAVLDPKADAERIAELQVDRDNARGQERELAERYDKLDRIHLTRGDWYDLTHETREDATAARIELEARAKAREAEAAKAQAETADVEAEQSNEATAEATVDATAEATGEADRSVDAETVAEAVVETPEADRAPAEATAEATVDHSAEQQTEPKQDRASERDAEAERDQADERAAGAEPEAEREREGAAAARSAQAALDTKAKRGAQRPVGEKIAEAKAAKEAAKKTEQVTDQGQDAEQTKETSPAVHSVKAALGDNAGKPAERKTVDLDAELRQVDEAAKEIEKRTAEHEARQAELAKAQKAEKARRARRDAAARRSAERGRDRGIGR